jgi:hypothetical protein
VMVLAGLLVLFAAAATLFALRQHPAPSPNQLTAQLISSTPFYGSPLAIPGTIQTEDFDNGGEGVAPPKERTRPQRNFKRGRGAPRWPV